MVISKQQIARKQFPYESDHEPIMSIGWQHALIQPSLTTI
jgi:hypothetical protein